MTASSEILFGSDSNVAPIGIIAMNSVTELGKKIDDYLVDWAGKGGINVDSFLVESECPRFSSSIMQAGGFCKDVSFFRGETFS